MILWLGLSTMIAGIVLGANIVLGVLNQMGVIPDYPNTAALLLLIGILATFSTLGAVANLHRAISKKGGTTNADD